MRPGCRRNNCTKSALTCRPPTRLIRPGPRPLRRRLKLQRKPSCSPSPARGSQRGRPRRTVSPGRPNCPESGCRGPPEDVDRGRGGRRALHACPPAGCRPLSRPAHERPAPAAGRPNRRLPAAWASPARAMASARSRRRSPKSPRSQIMPVPSRAGVKGPAVVAVWSRTARQRAGRIGTARQTARPWPAGTASCVTVRHALVGTFNPRVVGSIPTGPTTLTCTWARESPDRVRG
jgi:hypothetical protein